jgi:Glycosyltransferase family 87
VEVAVGLIRRAPSRPTLILLAAAAAALVFLAQQAVLMTIGLDFSGDAEAYWRTDLDRLYEDSAFNTANAYLYSPVFAQVISPLTDLTFRGFYAVWTTIQNLALMFIVGPVAGAASQYVFPGVRGNLFSGNIHILMALAIVVGFRYPAAWSFMLLTKVTPGVGLLWFAVRREWRALAIALGVTLALALVSFILAPQAWFDWFELLASSSGSAVTEGNVIELPLSVRIAAAAVIVVVAALTSQRWLVPVSVLLAQPAVWRSGPAILLAVVPLFIADRFPGLVDRARAAPPWLRLLLAPWLWATAARTAPARLDRPGHEVIHAA